MTPGERVRRLREIRGDSLAQAQDRTGVNRQKLFRIERGERPSSFMATMSQIARAYGVSLEKLMRDPAGDFEWMIRGCELSERARHLLLSRAQRVLMACHFLLGHYPSEFRVERLAAATGMTEDELRRLLVSWAKPNPGPMRVQKLADAVERLSGISRTWMDNGWFADEGVGAHLWRLVDSIPAQIEAAMNTQERTGATDSHWLRSLSVIRGSICSGRKWLRRNQWFNKGCFLLPEWRTPTPCSRTLPPDARCRR